jgi:hypothetical protein
MPRITFQLVSPEVMIVEEAGQVCVAESCGIMNAAAGEPSIIKLVSFFRRWKHTSWLRSVQVSSI